MSPFWTAFAVTFAIIVALLLLGAGLFWLLKRIADRFGGHVAAACVAIPLMVVYIAFIVAAAVVSS